MEPEILKKFVKENVIRREDIFNICHQFNKEINKTKSSWRCRRKCSDCEAEYHPFCGLYNVGLLGFIAKSDYSEAFVQKFLVPGESLVFNSLPISDYYLVHPCLQRVLSLNLNEDNIIGYGLPWKTKLKNGRKNNIGNKYANFLAKIDHIYTEDYNVIGDYVRFEEQIRNQLQEDCHQIINSLSNKSDSYENYLIWALPGTGKTSMVKEVIKNLIG
ncbi:hypothetical protein SDC9_157774 [bioreactor metagenome]|uniref:Uncharacterized protein n=1 Tax=bioreactor metagenome TaxID=1076179 RepID=A0A645FAW9_9ZZZZ